MNKGLLFLALLAAVYLLEECLWRQKDWAAWALGWLFPGPGRDRPPREGEEAGEDLPL